MLLHAVQPAGAPRPQQPSAEVLLFTGGQLANEAARPLWIYRDHHGKIQGPFSAANMVQWCSTGRLPQDLLVCGITQATATQPLDAIPASFYQPLQRLVAQTAAGGHYTPVSISKQPTAATPAVQLVQQRQPQQPVMAPLQPAAAAAAPLQPQRVGLVQQVQGAMPLPTAVRPAMPMQVAQVGGGLQPQAVMVQQPQGQQLVAAQPLAAAGLHPVMMMQRPQQPQMMVQQQPMMQVMRPQLQGMQPQQAVMQQVPAGGMQPTPAGTLMLQPAQQQQQGVPMQQIALQQQQLLQPPQQQAPIMANQALPQPLSGGMLVPAAARLGQQAAPVGGAAGTLPGVALLPGHALGRLAATPGSGMATPLVAMTHLSSSGPPSGRSDSASAAGRLLPLVGAAGSGPASTGSTPASACRPGSLADADDVIDDLLFDLVEDVAVDAGEGPRGVRSSSKPRDAAAAASPAPAASDDSILLGQALASRGTHQAHAGIDTRLLAGTLQQQQQQHQAGAQTVAGLQLLPSSANGTAQPATGATALVPQPVPAGSPACQPQTAAGQPAAASPAAASAGADASSRQFNPFNWGPSIIDTAIGGQHTPGQQQLASQQGAAGGHSASQLTEEQVLAALMPELAQAGMSAEQQVQLLKQLLGKQQQQQQQGQSAGAAAAQPLPQQQQGGVGAASVQQPAGALGSQQQPRGDEAGDEFDALMLPSDLFDLLDGHASSPTRARSRTGGLNLPGASIWSVGSDQRDGDEDGQPGSAGNKYVPPGRRSSVDSWQQHAPGSNSAQLGPRSSSSSGVPPPPPPGLPPAAWSPRASREPLQRSSSSYVPPHARQRSSSPPPVGYGGDRGQQAQWDDPQRDARGYEQQPRGQARGDGSSSVPPHWPPPPPPRGSAREAHAGEDGGGSSGRAHLMRLLEAAGSRPPPPPPPGAHRPPPPHAHHHPQRLPPGFESELAEYDEHGGSSRGRYEAEGGGHDWPREHADARGGGPGARGGRPGPPARWLPDDRDGSWAGAAGAHYGGDGDAPRAGHSRGRYHHADSDAAYADDEFAGHGSSRRGREHAGPGRGGGSRARHAAGDAALEGGGPGSLTWQQQRLLGEDEPQQHHAAGDSRAARRGGARGGEEPDRRERHRSPESGRRGMYGSPPVPGPQPSQHLRAAAQQGSKEGRAGRRQQSGDFAKQLGGAGGGGREPPGRGDGLVRTASNGRQAAQMSEAERRYLEEWPTVDSGGGAHGGGGAGGKAGSSAEVAHTASAAASAAMAAVAGLTSGGAGSGKSGRRASYSSDGLPAAPPGSGGADAVQQHTADSSREAGDAGASAAAGSRRGGLRQSSLFNSVIGQLRRQNKERPDAAEGGFDEFDGSPHQRGGSYLTAAASSKGARSSEGAGKPSGKARPDADHPTSLGEADEAPDTANSCDSSSGSAIATIAQRTDAQA